MTEAEKYLLLRGALEKIAYGQPDKERLYAYTQPELRQIAREALKALEDE